MSWRKNWDARIPYPPFDLARRWDEIEYLEAEKERETERAIDKNVISQSKLGSFIEATANTAIGFIVALLSQIVVFPLVGIHVPLSTNLEIGLYFTIISVLRSYVLRRWFNRRLHAAAERLAAKAT